MHPVPLLPADLAEPEALVSAVRARRGGQLFALDRMLLHSPPLAEGWNTFLGAVRRGLSLSPRLAELAICRVAVLNDAPYEWHHHAPEFRAAGGTEAELAALQETEAASAATLGTVEQQIVRLTDEMTRDIRPAPEVLAHLRDALGDRAVVELIATIAAYNMVSRFLVACGIAPEDDTGSANAIAD